MHSEYPLVQLVDAPDVSAALRFDFNAGTVWPDGDSFSLGAPPLLGDPGGVGAEYGYRNITFLLTVRDGERAALRRQSVLARALLRDDNWLLFRLSESSAPMWFKLVRSSPGEGSLATVYRDREVNDWRFNVSLVAEPEAVGERITLPPVVVGNNPAAEGLAVVLPEIVGDAPAPLVVRIPAGGTTFVQPLMSVASFQTWPGLHYWQAESWTLGIDATVTANSGASNGSQVSVSFATQTARRVRLTGGVAPSVAGRYRLFVRASLATGTGTAIITGGGVACVKPKVTSVIGSSGWQIVELGTYAFPRGNMPTVDNYTIVPRANEVTIAAAKEGSFNNLRLDYIVALPVDTRAASLVTSLEFRDADKANGAADYLIDGEQEFVSWLEAGAYGQGSTPVPAGDYVRVTPGMVNVLHFLSRRRSTADIGADATTASTTLEVSYRPRYVYLGAG